LGNWNAHEHQEIKELIEVVSQHGITDLEVERSGVKSRRIRKEGQPVVVSSGAGPLDRARQGIHLRQHHVVSATAALRDSVLSMKMKSLREVSDRRDFYRSPNPDASLLSKQATRLSLVAFCASLRAMKLMNEIEAEVVARLSRST
jgi:biotin carboxyl carrier protein